MKIEFIAPRDLDALSRSVMPGDVLESPKDAPEELLQAYVGNGIAREIPAQTKPAPKDTPKIDGGE